VWEPLRRHFDGLYLSFESSTDPRRLAEAFPEPTLARLRDLKRRYDPDGLLVDNFPLTLEEVSR
jgi:FAD/FMN-containing dehydrogenase